MIKLDFAKNKTYYVVGLGKSNDAVIKSLGKQGADVRIWDDNPEALFKYDSAMICPLDKAPWSKIKSVISAPGIPNGHPILQMAIEKDVPVICDVDLYAQSKPQSKIIGITGTNGKSTVTAMVHHILNSDDKSQIGGNFGVPVMNLKIRMDYTVLELSSYQLDRSPSLQCDVACLLNITSDHLQWHGGMDHYVEAKSKIFTKAMAKIISIDDEYCQSIYDRHDNALPLTIYGDELPFAKSDFPKIKGDHNYQNYLAAYWICKALKIEDDVIFDRMRSFEGLNHRQFLVRNINGISYINDSKATNVEASKMALQSYNNIVWIAGGQAKDGGLDSIDAALGQIQKVYLYGECASEFAQYLSLRGIDVEVVETLNEATLLAHGYAQNLRGEPSGSPTVLLSPAAASLDQFDNFEDRGDHFAELVNDLSEDRS